ncbi:MAG: alkaline phosphatase family protein [Chthoniobacterales bacterium]
MSKILFIGLDAADWELISTKIAAGKLPHLARLVAHGVSGPLRSIYPLFSPALWSTIATGKRPYEHGITGFTLPDDSGKGLRPCDRRSRRSPALWNMFSHYQKTSNIVGWWTTAPAEEIQGVMIDETFRIAHRPSHEPWDIPPKSVSPASIATIVAQERVHPQQLSEALLRALVPKLYEIDPSADFRIAAIAKILAEDLTTLQVTLRLMSEEPWDLTAPYLIGLDSLSHLAMCYRPPAFPGEKELDCELYGEVVDRAYDLYDSWVGQLVKAAGEQATVVIASDHGFYHDIRKPTSLGIQETAPAIQHAPIGTLIMKGPHLHQGITIHHATILDLCPTLLTLAALPVGRDMPGKVLLKAFSRKPTIKKINSWNRYWKSTPLIIEPSSEDTAAALRQLVSLGYLQEIPSNKQTAFQEAWCNELFHRALSFLDDERFDQAIPLLEKAFCAAQQGPHTFSRTDILAELAMAYFRLGYKRRAAAYFYKLVRYRRRDAREATQEFWKKAASITSVTSPPTFSSTEATESSKTSVEFEQKSDLSFAEAWEIRHLMARANLDEEGMRFTVTLARFLAYTCNKDLALLVTYAEEHPQDLFAQLHVGLFALEHHMDKQGITSLRRVATARPEEATPLAFLANYYCQKNQFAQAEQSAREALHRNPLHRSSWLALATTLVHQGRWNEASKAAREAMKSPLQRSDAYTLLAHITLKRKKDPARATRYHELAEKSKLILKKEIPLSLVSRKKNQRLEKKTPIRVAHRRLSSVNAPIIVTGLPRSGTSLIMQMLAAGGIPIDTDHHRRADMHNPNGYFEQEKVKTITRTANFLKAGAATKVVIPLVLNLSPHNDYSLIWIQRPLEEVIESQDQMAGLTTKASTLENVYRHYEIKTAEHIQHASWPLLQLEYPSVVQHPIQTAQAIADFLKKDLNIEAMGAAVVPSLYRVRSFQSPASR